MTMSVVVDHSDGGGGVNEKLSLRSSDEACTCVFAVLLDTIVNMIILMMLMMR